MTMQAVVVDPSAPGRLVLVAVPLPSPRADEALIQVQAISLNRGETRRAMTAEAGHRPGWDLAGVVTQGAANGSGPAAGTRVVGWLPAGAWAQFAAVPTNAIAALPDNVSYADASTLPVAGLTALYALEKNGSVLDRRVLITGATGGVGYLAVQMARHAGAHVVGVARTEARAALVRAAGAHDVFISDDAHEAAQHGPFHIVVDGVGGAVLANCLSALAPGGMAVAYGVTIGPEIAFDLGAFFRTGGASLYGFTLFHEIRYESAASGLGRLARMVGEGALRPLIEVETSWTAVAAVAQRLLDRDFAGKAVLTVA